MRLLAAAVLALCAPLAAAQAPLKVTRLAEFGEGLSEPHDAAFSPDGRLIYLTDMGNSLVRVLDAMTLRLLGTGRRGRGANAFYKPEAVIARGPHLWVIDTYNDRVVLLRLELP